MARQSWTDKGKPDEKAKPAAEFQPPTPEKKKKARKRKRPWIERRPEWLER